MHYPVSTLRMTGSLKQREKVCNILYYYNISLMTCSCQQTSHVFVCEKIYILVNNGKNQSLSNKMNVDIKTSLKQYFNIVCSIKFIGALSTKQVFFKFSTCI